jgi:hypothetical protein
MAQEFPETSKFNINQEKFEKNSDKIFGKREKIPCEKCDLTTMMKRGAPYKCSHCGHEGIAPKEK